MYLLCCVMFLLSITSMGDNENYHFTAVDKKVKFDITADACRKIMNSIQQ